MLTENQRKMIDERKLGLEDAKRKKYIDYTLRQYAKKQLDSIDGLTEVLETLPESQTKAIVTLQHAKSCINLLKKIAAIVDFAPIEFDRNGKPWAVYRFKSLQIDPDPSGGERRTVYTTKLMFPPKPEEVELVKSLGPQINVLKNLFETDQDRAGYDTDDWNRIVVPRINEIANKRGENKIHRMEFEDLFTVIDAKPNTSHLSNER